MRFLMEADSWGNNNSGSITASYATGTVSVTSTAADTSAAGGLVGGNLNSGSITASYATGDVTITYYAYGGGLVYGTSGSISGYATDVTAITATGWRGILVVV